MKSQTQRAEKAIQQAVICGSDKLKDEPQAYRRIRLEDVNNAI